MGKRWRRGGGPGRWGLLLTALVAGVVLCVNAIMTYRSADELFEAAGYGQAELFMRSLRRELGDAPPSDNLFTEFLNDNKDMGLLYVALADWEGATLASAGEPLDTKRGLAAPGFRKVGLTLTGERFRFVARVPPRLARSGSAMDGPMRRQMMQGGEQGMAAPDRSPLIVVIEFEPLVWKEIRLRNTLTMVAAFVASGLLLASALVFWRMNRRNAEEEAHRAEQERLALLGQMTAVLAHEIRNPLAALKGHAQLLEEDLEGKPQGAKASLVVEEAVRLQKLITELLDFARNNNLNLAPVDPVALVAEAAAQVDPERVLVSSAEVGPWQLDRGRLLLALTNVIRNGVQASPEGERVIVEVTTSQEALTITVSDRGEGIAEEEIHRIFEPFRTTRVKGVGLGLAVTKKIVEAHGGTITAMNGASGGAVFTLTFPRKA